MTTLLLTSRTGGTPVPTAWYPMKFAPRDGTLIALKHEKWLIQQQMNQYAPTPLRGVFPIVGWSVRERQWIFTDQILSTEAPIRELEWEDLFERTRGSNQPFYWGTLRLK